VEGPIAGTSGQSYWGSQAAALFSWEPVDFGLRSAVVGRARSAADKATSDLTLTRLQVASTVGSIFLAAAAAQQAVAATQAEVDRWQVFDQSIHRLVDSTLRPGVDASRADAQLAQAKIRFIQAQGSQQQMLARLAALMGAAGSQIQLDAARLLAAAPTGSVPNANPSTHPLAEDRMAVVRQTQAQEKMLDRADYPRVFLQAEGFGRGSEVPNNGSIVGNGDGLFPARGNWIAGVTVTFPNVFDFKALSAQKQISKANEKAQQAQYDRTLQDLTGEAQAAIVQLQNAQLIAQQTPIELASAQASEMQSRARYDATLAPLTEMADAESLLTQAEIDNALARLNVWRALIGVAVAQGDLQPFLNLLSPANP
jgi:outer membrane protein TolC